MSACKPPTAARSLLCGLLAIAAVIAPASAAAAASARTPTHAVSSNWAGYVALPGAATRFSAVSATWTAPSVTCARGHASYSATWVGLGGYRESANALEQAGTNADCSSGGRAVYSSWYELLPAAPVSLSLSIHPGDVVSASVTLRARHVTLRVRDITSGQRFSATLRAAAVDASTAEWIVEAPSECSSENACVPLPLSDFGTVAFSGASASARGHTGAIADPLWAATALELRQSPLRAGPREGAVAGGHRASAVTAAWPSAPDAVSGAFSVAWQQQGVLAQEPTAPTLPGAGG